MKKIFVLLALVFLVTGCSIKEIPQDNLEDAIDSVLVGSADLENQYFAGYQYYLPREVSIIDKFDYNTILLHKRNRLYLYVDVISYYHKTKEEYETNDNLYFSKVLEYGNKKGYVNIDKENEDKYYIDIVYNYGKIEAYSNKENLSSTVLNSLVILNTIKFNDAVIDSLIGENKIEYKEEKFNLFNSDSNNDGYLNIDENHTSNKNKEEDELIDEEIIEIEDFDELD